MRKRSKTRNGVLAGVAMTGWLLAGAASAVQPDTVPRTGMDGMSASQSWFGPAASKRPSAQPTSPPVFAQRSGKGKPLASRRGGIRACEQRLGDATANLDAISADLGMCKVDLGDVTANLEKITADLGTCNGDLMTCEDDLDQCLASNVVFPGDGAGNGANLAYEECADGLTVADLNTGLLWELKVAGNALCTDFLHRANSGCEWGQATGAWIDAVNGELYAGFSDWRLPNVRELQSIVDYGKRLPAIDPAFGDMPALPLYWSVTPLLDSAPAEAWTVNFQAGTLSTFPKISPLQVRAVRNGSCF